MINATQIRVGNFLKVDDQLCRVLKVQHVTPGKGNAVVQTDLRNLSTGIKFNRRFRSTETVEDVEINDRKMQFLYQEGETFHFMDPENYNQLEMKEDFIEEAIPFLIPETVITVSLYDGQPVGIRLPARVSLQISECSPPTKGMAGESKEAILENGHRIRVPLFIKSGDRVVIDTESNSYLEKA